MGRIIGEVRPAFVEVENSPLLVGRGLAVVIGDLAAMGFDAVWGCVSAAECGANHDRARAWVVGRNRTDAIGVDVEGSSENALTRVDGRSRLRNRLDYWVERDGKHGRLNPDYVEWVMGWPIGWTDVKPLDTGRYPEWLRQHGECSEAFE